MNVRERARVRFLNPVLMLLMICCLTGVTSQVAQAQTYAVLHSFSGGADGATPMAGLTPDAAGNFYGTAQYGGDPGCGGCGTVFKLARKNGAWVFTPLYAFHGGTDGAWPAARVVIGPDGALYGTTTGGNGSSCSNNGCGTVFRLTPQATFCPTVSCPWVETVLYRFAGAPDEKYPARAIWFLTRQVTFMVRHARVVPAAGELCTSSRTPMERGQKVSSITSPGSPMAQSPMELFSKTTAVFTAQPNKAAWCSGLFRSGFDLQTRRLRARDGRKAWYISSTMTM